MRFEATVRIEAPASQVYASLQDISVLSQCAGDYQPPIVLTAEGDHLDASIQVAIGDITLACRARLAWLERQPFELARVQALVWIKQPQSPTTATPHAVVDNTFQLEAVNPTQTRLLWQGELQLHTMLRGVPQRSIRSFVAQQSYAFFTCLKCAAERASAPPSQAGV